MPSAWARRLSLGHLRASSPNCRLAVRVEQGERVEKLAVPEGIPLDLCKPSLVADVIPVGLDDVDLVINDLLGIGPREVVYGSAVDAPRDLAVTPSVLADGHHLLSFAARPRVRADVVCRCQREQFTVPERRLIARVVVGVRGEDVEGDPCEEVSERGVRIGEASADDVSKICVAGVATPGLAEPKNGQCRDHHSALSSREPVEALDEHDLLPEGLRHLDIGHPDPSQLCEAHGDELPLDHRVGVAGRAELGDQASVTVVEQGLGPCTSNRCSTQQGLTQGGWEWHAVLDVLAVSYTHLRAHETDSYL